MEGSGASSRLREEEEGVESIECESRMDMDGRCSSLKEALESGWDHV